MDPLELAVEQGGFLTWDQARRRGVPRRSLDALVADNLLEHPLRGVFLVAAQRTPQERHRLTVAAVLAQYPGHWASHGSALGLCGAALYGVPLQKIHLASRRDSSRTIPGVSHHVLRPGDLTATLEGQPLVHPALSCVLVAAACGREAGVVAMDSLVHRGLVTCEELVEIVESGRVRRGVRAARVAVQQVDPACESPGESLLRCRLHDLGLPFDTQVAISTRGRDYRVDFLVRGRTILEFDGRLKYGGADGADALVREKRREDELRLEGFGFLRVVWRDLDNLAALAAAIDRASLRADTLESPRHAEDF